MQYVCAGCHVTTEDIRGVDCVHQLSNEIICPTYFPGVSPHLVDVHNEFVSDLYYVRDLYRFACSISSRTNGLF